MVHPYVEIIYTFFGLDCALGGARRDERALGPESAAEALERIRQDEFFPDVGMN